MADRRWLVRERLEEGPHRAGIRAPEEEGAALPRWHLGAQSPAREARIARTHLPLAGSSAPCSGQVMTTLRVRVLGPLSRPSVAPVRVQAESRGCVGVAAVRVCLRGVRQTGPGGPEGCRDQTAAPTAAAGRGPPQGSGSREADLRRGDCPPTLASLSWSNKAGPVINWREQLPTAGAEAVAERDGRHLGKGQVHPPPPTCQSFSRTCTGGAGQEAPGKGDTRLQSPGPHLPRRDAEPPGCSLR